MLKNISITIVTAIIAIGFFGCAQFNMAETDTPLDKNWGRSFESARYNQILVPEAGKSSAPVEGISGQKTETTMKDYFSSETNKLKTDSKVDF